ncbi:MAG: hypothetical protein U9R58_02470, partial [Chloroflexota bacterium]|nr:hypothetical protein [Chloroflexota bacterium]
MPKYFSYSSERIFRKICVPLILILVVIQVTTSCAPKNLVSQPDTAQSSDTPTAYPIVDSSQNSTSFEFNQGAAMLPASQNDLAGLSNAPRYNIDLRINSDDRSFEGRSQVDYTNTEDVDLNILYFRLLPNGGKSYGSGSLTVNRVLVDGEPVQSQLSEHGTVLAVPLTANLSPSDSVQITFDFVGQVPDVGRDGEDSNGYGIFSYNQDVMALAGWYPILAVYDEDGWNLDPVSSIGDSVYSDIAFYNLLVTAPGDLVVITTGIEVGREGTADAVSTQFVSGPVRDFFLIMSPDFEVETST